MRLASEINFGPYGLNIKPNLHDDQTELIIKFLRNRSRVQKELARSITYSYRPH